MNHHILIFKNQKSSEMNQQVARWWFQKVYSFFLCSSLLGEMIQFDSYFSDGLGKNHQLELKSFISVAFWNSGGPPSTDFWANLNTKLVRLGVSACRLRLLSNESRELSEKDSYEVSLFRGDMGEGDEGLGVFFVFC